MVNYSNKRREPCHVTLGIFDVHKTSKIVMVVQLKELFVCFELCDKVGTYVKDEGANLNTLTNTFNKHSFMCPLMTIEPYFDTCYGHAMSKC